MVYYGKPSKACSLCRARKIKCDQLRPACSQCVRVAIECPGYRNPLDLIFRDEREGVAKRVARSATAKLLHTDDNQADRDKPIFTRVDYTGLPNCHRSHLTRSITPSERELVAPLFFHYFDVEDTTSGHAIISCLPKTISTAEDDVLSAAISSVGYALLSNLRNSPNVLIVARQKYAIAVRLTRNALKSSVKTETGYIVLVVLLLAIFEVITCKDRQSLSAWSSHLEGASTLLQLQGLDMSTCTSGGTIEKGEKLFLQLRCKALVNCLHRRLAVPDSMLRWSFAGARMLHTSEEFLGAKLGDIIVRLANFRAAMGSKDSFHSDQSVSFVRQMEHDLETWASSLPSVWNYEIRTCIGQNSFYRMSYHKYPSFTVAVMWNHYRATRCLANDILLTFLDPSRYSNQDLDQVFLLEERDRTHGVIRKLCNDIFGSVPYFLGQKHEKDPPKPGVGALEVMWALFSSACMRSISEEQRGWALMKMDNIGHEMGINQALTLASMVRSQVQLVELSGGFDLSQENPLCAKPCR